MTQIVFKNTKNPAPLQNYVKNLKFVDMIQDSYLSVPAPAEGLFKDNGSRFISFAYPVETEEEVKDIVADLKKRYHDARHHCYAYRLGYLGDRFRANDDGEPSGSAGRPILGQIDSRGLSDTLVVVVRYFGGIKLGIPGLIRAYKTSTSEALDKAGLFPGILSGGVLPRKTFSMGEAEEKRYYLDCLRGCQRSGALSLKKYNKT